jgi:hypothetical protein
MIIVSIINMFSSCIIIIVLYMLTTYLRAAAPAADPGKRGKESNQF